MAPVPRPRAQGAGLRALRAGGYRCCLARGPVCWCEEVPSAAGGPREPEELGWECACVCVCARAGLCSRVHVFIRVLRVRIRVSVHVGCVMCHHVSGAARPSTASAVGAGRLSYLGSSLLQAACCFPCSCTRPPRALGLRQGCQAGAIRGREGRRAGHVGHGSHGRWHTVPTCLEAVTWGCYASGWVGWGQGTAAVPIFSSSAITKTRGTPDSCQRTEVSLTGQERACWGEKVERRWEGPALHPIPSLAPIQEAKGGRQELWGAILSSSSPRLR